MAALNKSFEYFMHMHKVSDTNVVDESWQMSFT